MACLSTDRDAHRATSASSGPDKERATPEKSPENLTRNQPHLLLTYLLTFACYGWHLPGQEGTIDRHHNIHGNRLPDVNFPLLSTSQLALTQPVFEIEIDSQATVLEAIREVCDYKNWRLLAVHVRSNHVHIVADSDTTPEKSLGVFKAYASRALNTAHPSERDRKRWARHGSTRYLWNVEQINAAIRYVVDKQGTPTAVYEEPERCCLWGTLYRPRVT